MSIEDIKEILLNCYSKDLCYPKIQNKWNNNNKCFGMCAITSLIINDYFGGKICKIHVDNTSHYFNLIENNIIDLTSSQFDCDIDYSNYQIVDRSQMLNEDTKSRYNKLKKMIIKYIQNEK